jgi:hypothetical protein
MINNIELKDIIFNIRYPVGCYYVQYPENNTNIHDDDDIEIGDLDTMLPYAKSPESLFGGKWEEKFKGESVFFRTGGILSDDTRLNGVQANAMKNLYGWTSIAQTNLWNPGFGSQGILEETKEIPSIGTDDKSKDAYILLIVMAVVLAVAAVVSAGAVLAVGVVGILATAIVVIGIIAYVAGVVALSVKAVNERDSSDWLYNGTPGKPGDTVDAKKGQIVENRGSDSGHQNLLDPSLQSTVSGYELRVRNRIIKVWKRIS